MTIREATFFILNQLKPVFGEGESAQLTDMVMEHITGSGKTERMMYRNEAITPAEAQRVAEYTRRLLQHEPVQYILEEAWFANRKFYVNNQVLIPRPETEELVDWIVSDLNHRTEPFTLLDIGTGSGCIPVSLQLKLPLAAVWALDISAGALDVARRNASAAAAPVHFLQADILDEKGWSALPAFDIIVSNPPYIPEHNKASMEPNVLEYEPHTALFVPDEDALLFYKAIARFATGHLNRNGLLYVEIHEELGPAVLEMLAGEGFQSWLKKDMQQKDRMVKSGLLTGGI